MTLTYKDREILQDTIEKYFVKNHVAIHAEVVNHFLREGFS